MKTVCQIDRCTSCTACIEICPKNCITLKKMYSSTNAIIDETKCINCGLCYKICQQNRTILFEKKSNNVFEGYSKDIDERRKSSSGGFATIFAKYILQKKGYVAGAVYDNGSIKHILTNNIFDLERMRGSKYVKSDLSDVFKEIVKVIDNHYVLFIGTPCQIYGLKIYLKTINKDANLITIDIICHGTPQQDILQRYLKEKKLKSKVNSLSFRSGNNFFISLNNEKIKRGYDLYSLGFLKGLFYTENCYFCKFARNERISDITIGDSWGTKIENSQDGVSLCICNTTIGLKLFHNVEKELYFKRTNIDYCSTFNEQLIKPSEKNNKTEKFFILLKKHSVKYCIFVCLPFDSAIQFLKLIAIKFIHQEI